MLTITKAESLSLVREKDIWGDLFNYRNRDVYTVRGKLYGDYSVESIVQIWQGMSGMITQVTGTYIPFSINGVVVGTGKIQNLSFEPSTDVREKNYNVTFEVAKTGNLYNLTGAAYQYLQLITGIAPYLNSFSETQSLNQVNSDTVNFEQQVSIDLNASFSEIPIARYSGAYQTATGFFGSLTDSIPSFFDTDFNAFDYHVKTYTGLDPIKYRSETFDSINNKYSFTERYNYQKGRNYIHEYNHSLNYDQNGVTTVTEAGFAKATAKVAARITYAEIGFEEILTGIYSRVTGVYGRWNNVYSTGGCALVNYPIQKTVSRNYIAGQLDYSYAYTNNPAQKSGYSWSYENSIELQSDGYVSISENGDIIGLGKNRTGNFPIVSGAWFGTIRPGITGRINSLYSNTSGYFNPVCFYPGTPVAINSEETYSEYRGTISYSQNFTDDPSYFATGNFVMIKTTIADNRPVHLTNFFNIINFQELAQTSFQSTLGTYSNQVEIIGRSGLSIPTYLAAATGKVTIPSGMLYPLPPTYSFSPNSRNFSYQQDYIYAKYRGMNDSAI